MAGSTDDVDSKKESKPLKDMTFEIMCVGDSITTGTCPEDNIDMLHVERDDLWAAVIDMRTGSSFSLLPQLIAAHLSPPDAAHLSPPGVLPDEGPRC